MTNKKKQKARALAAKSGMSYQAAVNVLNAKQAPADPLTFASFQELEAASEKLRSEGWQVLPADDPSEGQLGYMAYRYEVDDKPWAPDTGVESEPPPGAREVSTHLKWYPFGRMSARITHDFRWVGSRPGENIVHVVDQGGTRNETLVSGLDFERILNELFAANRAKGNLFRADQPKSLKLGFVSYREGTVFETLVSLSTFKWTAREVSVGGEPFAEWREKVPSLRALCSET